MKIAIPFIILQIFILNSLIGQGCDYYNPRFQVKAELDVYYGSAETYDGQMDSLFMNIYKPVGDVNSERPLAIWCFGGGFFAGEKESFDDICREMASRGYVAATIDYRLGYSNAPLLPYPFAFDDKELLRAGFRAMQDAKGAIRFMKNRAVSDSVDIEKVFVGGASAGAITALAATFLNQESESDSTVMGNIAPANGVPPLPRPDLGSIEGTLNLGQHDATVAGVLNIFGAVFDTAQISDQKDKIIYSYHQTMDPIVPCGHDKAYWGLPFIPDNMPYGYGSCVITEHLQAIGYDEDLYQTRIHNGDAHDIHDADLVFEEINAFLNYHLCGINVSNEDVEVSDLEIFPNPVSDYLFLPDVNDTAVHVRDAWGRTVMNGNVSNGQIDLTQLKSGTYFIILEETGVYRRFVKI